MKYFLTSSVYYAVMCMVLLVSCEQKEEAPAPSIKIINFTKPTIEKGATISFSLEILALESIDIFQVSRVSFNSEDLILAKANGFNSSTKHRHLFDFVITDWEGDVILKFEVKDKKGEIAAVLHKLTVNPIVSPPFDRTKHEMKYENTKGEISNRSGSSQSAFDLITNVRRSTGSAISDMQNVSTTGWIKGWESVRNTTFVVANSLVEKFNDKNEIITLQDAIEAFKEGTVMKSISDVKDGDIYVAKIKGGNSFVILKIVSVDEDDDGTQAQNIKFSYKKLAEYSGQ